MRNAAIASLLLLVGGCASSGVKVDPSAVNAFQSGKTTYEEVVGTLGTPSIDTLGSDGKRVVAYTFSEMKVRPETFIPYVGAFVGGSDVKASSVVFRFDQKGLLTGFATSNSSQGAGLGFAAR